MSKDTAYVTNMIRKDVLRTDRLHPYFIKTEAGDENDNIESLYNILTTYVARSKPLNNIDEREVGVSGRACL